MKALQCVSCGAPIRHGASKCEYCGMTYERDYWTGTVKYIALHTNSRKLGAEARIPERLINDPFDKEFAARKVKRDLTLQLAEALEMMVPIRLRRDPFEEVVIASTEIWVEEPLDKH